MIFEEKEIMSSQKKKKIDNKQYVLKMVQKKFNKRLIIKCLKCSSIQNLKYTKHKKKYILKNFYKKDSNSQI